MNLTDVESFTLGELSELEALTGMDIKTILAGISGGEMSLTLLQAVLCIVGRRDNPEYTMADAAEIRITDLIDQGLIEQS